MGNDLEILRLPHEVGTVPITPEEEAQWLIAYGKITILIHGDGTRHRILDPWETGEGS